MAMVKNILLIRFLLKNRFSNFVRDFKTTERFIANSIFLILLLLNSVVTSYLLEFFYKQNDKYAADILVKYTLFYFFIIPISLIFFPSFKRKAQFFGELDPVRNFDRAIVEVICNFLRFNYITLLCSLILLVNLNSFTGFRFFLEGFAAIIASSMCCLLIQHVFYFRFSAIIRVLNISFVVAIVYLAFTDLVDGILVYLASIILLFADYFFLQKVEPIHERSPKSVNGRKSSLFLILTKICINTFTVRINLFLALVVKFGFLFMFLSKPSMSNANLIMLLASSLILFTYIFNNIFGYLKTTFNTLILRCNLIVLFKAYICILLLPIILDVIFSLLLWIFFKMPVVSFVLIYVLILLCNIIIGFYSSIFGRFEVYRAVNLGGFKSNTPLAYNMLSILVSISIIIVHLFIGSLYTMSICIFFLTYVYYRLIFKKEMGHGSRDIYSILNR